MNVIITMAGLGSRFRQAGFKVPKYMIKVKKRTLFSWSLESLRSFINQGEHFIFIVRKEDNAQHFIMKECRSLGIEYFKVIMLDHLTDGQATTVLYAKSHIAHESQPIAIYNIDTYVEPEFIKTSNIHGSGWIPCFMGQGDVWSFVRVDENGKAVEVREKQRISPYATIGLYWFESFKCYENAYHAYYQEPNRMVKGERYIAPIYNQLIADRQEVFISEIPASAIHALGTPQDVENFALEA